MQNLIKDRPVTQGIIASAIVQIAWNGAAAVIAYITGHFALRSVPVWLAILVGAVVFFLLSVSYYIFVWARTRHRAKQATENPNTLPAESSEVQRLTDEIGTLETQLHNAQHEAHSLDKDLAGKKQQMKEVQRERDRYKAEMERQTSLKEDQHQSFLNSRRELAEFKAEADAQTRTYDVTFKGMKEEMDTFKRELENANKRVNEENNQKELLDRLYKDEKAKYEEIRWVLDIVWKQAQHLNRYVVIELLSTVRVYLDDSTSGGPRIRCSFKIRNKSIFPEITVHRDEVKGCFSFRGKALTERVRLDRLVPTWPNIDKLAYEQEGWIHLEQDLTSAETDRLKNALNSDDPIIGFEEIEIDVSGGTRFPDLNRTTLIIPEDFRRVLLKNCDIKSNTDNP